MATNDPISVFYSKMGRYPGNNKQWWIARADIDDPDATPPITAGDFLPEILDKLFAGNMRAPRGHFILDAFNKDRSFVSTIEDLPVQPTKERPPTVSFFSGRAWFACKSTVYFSQVLTEKHKAAWCYQEADPTSEVISDPIATDGGVIPIPEANKILKLLPNGGGILVFATNGVWHVRGGTSGFTATDISVDKVSSIGCTAPLSIVDTEQGVFWWSDVGILGMKQQTSAYGPVPGSYDRLNISELSIQSFYNDIPDEVRSQAKAAYDPKANTVTWLYRDDDVEEYQYNRTLVLDVSLSAFYPWKFGAIDDDNPPIVKDFFVADRLNNVTLDTDVSPSQIEYLTVEGSDLRLSQASNSLFVDWYEFNNEGAVYDSYVETGFELFNDAMRDKNITYIFTYLRRTENEYEDDELDDPSSCFLTIKWDWASGNHSNKWTSPVQVYRPGRLLFDNPDTGFGMVVTKSKVRGNGKAIQFKLGTSEPGRNFDIQGWSIAVTGNTTP